MSDFKDELDKWIFSLKYLGSHSGEDKDFARIFVNEPPLLRALEIAHYHSLSKAELSAYEAKEERRRIYAESFRTSRLNGHTAGKEEK